MLRKLMATFFVIALGLAPVALAGGSGGGAKCNSGNGNGSETLPENDCDPGNSGGHNNGGD